MFCSKCKQEQDPSLFSKTGKPLHLRSGWQAYCKPCALKAGNLWRSKNKERSNKNARLRAVTSLTRLKQLLNANTVDRSNLNLTQCLSKLEELNYTCEITGIPFTYTARSPTGLSIDRIDPTKGYTHDNIRFVCWWINAAMGNWGLNKLKELIEVWKINANSTI